MRTISHHVRRSDALGAVSRLLGSGGKTLNCDTWTADTGRVYGVRDGGPRDWIVVELTRAEGIQVRLDQLARLVDEHLGWADVHDRRAFELEQSGNEGLARARRSQAAAHRRIAGEWLEQMLAMVVETTGETLGEEGRAA